MIIDGSGCMECSLTAFVVARNPPGIEYQKSMLNSREAVHAPGYV